MTRLPNWRPRLYDYLAEGARTPFAYGQHDCAMFAAGAVEAMTGTDPAAEFRSRYSTLRGGLHMVGSLLGECDALFVRIPVLQAGVGDVAWVDEGFPALGVVLGEDVAVLRLEGQARAPLTLARGAYRV